MFFAAGLYETLSNFPKILVNSHIGNPKPPFFNVIIAVYEDWVTLDGCLKSLAAQSGAPGFEVIVVDDGSSEPAPGHILGWNRSFPIIVITQPHLGISAARNCGIRSSKAPALLFMDADCRVLPNCLQTLKTKIESSPQQSCFQLQLTGDCSTQMGRAEELRLRTLQTHLLQPDGTIRYLNTAGFAILRSRVQEDGNLFNPVAARGEDTFLLSTLMRKGELPIFVPGAIIQHAIVLSLLGCLRKDVRSAYAERKAYDLIAARGISIQLTNRDRLTILFTMWRGSSQPSTGRTAWFIVTGRQVLRLVVSAFHRLTH